MYRKPGRALFGSALLVCVLFISSCSSNSLVVPEAGPDEPISEGDLLAFNRGDSFAMLERVGPPDPIFRALGSAIVLALDQPVPGVEPIATENWVERSPANSMRSSVEWLLAGATLGVDEDVIERGLRGVEASVLAGLPSLLDTADGQAVLAMIGALHRMAGSSSASTNLLAEACGRFADIEASLAGARQRAALLSLGCESDGDSPDWSDAVPTSIDGCGLFLPYAGPQTAIDVPWVQACWREMFGYLLEGRDARSLSDVLTAILLSSESGDPPAPADRFVAIAAGRAWRFGGHVTPYVDGNSLLRMRENWVARTLGAPDLQLIDVGKTATPKDPDEVLMLAMAGMLAPNSPEVVSAEVNASLLVRGAWIAVRSADDECEVDLPDPVVPNSASRVTRTYAGLVLSRRVQCSAKDAVAAARRDRRARTIAAELASTTGVDNIDTLDRVAALVEENCALGVPLATAVLTRLARSAQVFASDSGLEYGNYSFDAYDSLTVVRHAAKDGCSGFWWDGAEELGSSP